MPRTVNVKRVSWVASNPTVALYEYQGQPPLLKEPHGAALRTDCEFVRTKPQVLDAIRSGLTAKRAKPRDVYETLVTGNETVNRPRDHKQVRNQAQTAGSGGCGKGGVNVADDVLSVLQCVQTSSFVKCAVLGHSQLPVVVAYSDEQILDIRRLCSSSSHASMGTVLGVDRTFNLGPCYITVCVYRNASVLRKKSMAHPIFIGPVMFHFDGKAETYRTFFRCVHDALCGDVVCAELQGDVEMVFGSDEEKAMVTVKSQIQYAHLYNTHPKLSQENCGKTLV